MKGPWTGVAIGVLAGAMVAGGVLLAVANRGGDGPSAAKAEAREKKKVTLEAGSKVELLLLEPLHSGAVDEGDRAKLVVVRDVERDGVVVVPAGTTMELEVTRSREGSVMSSLVNQPARLEVVFLPMDIDGESVEMAAYIDREETLELTRKTSSKDQASAALKALWEHPETQDFLVRLSERLNGDTSDDLDDPDSKRIMRDVAEQLGLTATAKAVGGEAQSVGGLLMATEKASRGQFGDMNAAEALLAFQAITELSHIANGVDRGLRSKIKGRNIKIPIGTRLTAYTAEPVTVMR